MRSNVFNVGKIGSPGEFEKDHQPPSVRYEIKVARCCRSYDDTIKEKDVTIMDVREFVTTKARAATHPIFGKITHETRLKQDKQEENKGKRHPGFRANGFATQGDARNTNTEGTVNKDICPCKANHCLSRCGEFRKMSWEKRRVFLKENKLCLNCLTTTYARVLSKTFAKYKDALENIQPSCTLTLKSKKVHHLIQTNKMEWMSWDQKPTAM